MPAPEPFRVTALGTRELTRAQARSHAFRVPSRGLRIPAELDDSMRTRMAAVALVTRDDGILWGPSAAALLGLPVPTRLEESDVHVLVPEGRPRPRRRGVRARQADIVTWETVHIDGLRCTSPARTFADLAWLLSRPDLLAVGDAAMRLHSMPAGELTAVIDRRLRYPGKVRAREVGAWVNPLAESPQESRLRGHIIIDGLPLPEVNGVIVDQWGGFLARCDLVYREHRVVVEYDGQVHASRERRFADAGRRTRLREHGWFVVEIVADDLVDPERALRKIRGALFAARPTDASSLVATTRR